MQETPVAYETRTPMSFDAAVERCRETLAQEGFGVLTEIDVQATLKKKLDVDREPFLILGACHPPSAHKATTAVPAVGVYLPCNVTVSVELITPVALEKGLRFAIREGGRTVGSGAITEIIE